jgi:hypothetical protein
MASVNNRINKNEECKGEWDVATSLLAYPKRHQTKNPVHKTASRKFTPVISASPLFIAFPVL